MFLIILLRTQFSWVLFIIFIFSIIYILIFERTKLTIFLIYIFVCFYGFYTIYPWDNINRFSLAFIPTVAIFIAVFISKLLNRKKVLLNMAIALTGIYLLLISTVIKLPEIQPQFVLYRNFLLQHYPLDKAAKFIKEKIPKGKVLGLQISGFAFYRDKFNINKDKIISISVEDFNKFTRQEINEFIRNNNVNCIMTSNAHEPYKIENIDLNIFAQKKVFKYDNGNKISLYLKDHNE